MHKQSKKMSNHFLTSSFLTSFLSFFNKTNYKLLNIKFTGAVETFSLDLWLSPRERWGSQEGGVYQPSISKTLSMSENIYYIHNYFIHYIYKWYLIVCLQCLTNSNSPPLTQLLSLRSKGVGDLSIWSTIRLSLTGCYNFISYKPPADAQKQENGEFFI